MTTDDAANVFTSATTATLLTYQAAGRVLAAEVRRLRQQPSINRCKAQQELGGGPCGACSACVLAQMNRADQAEADLAALRQRHAEAVKQCWYEAFGAGSRRSAYLPGYTKGDEPPGADTAWLASESAKQLKEPRHD